LAEKWFAEHLEKSETGGNGAPVDKNAELIVETLNQLLANNKLENPPRRLSCDKRKRESDRLQG